MKSLISITLLAVLFLAGAACAEQAAPPQPCLDDERFAEFDFWVGEWDVHIADGTFVGSNEITSPHRGCVLVENWSSAAGGGGMSVNFLDHQSGEWVQIWNDGNGSQINIRGGLTEEGMALTGTIHYIANDATLPFRGLWTPLPDGRVRQFFEQYDEASDSWAPWFEGFYTRKDDNDSSEED